MTGPQTAGRDRVNRAVRLLVGYRDDLELESKWWHRLLKVTFALLVVVCATFATLRVTSGLEPAPSTANAVVLTSLERVREAVERQNAAADVASAFLAEPGAVGMLQDDGAISKWPAVSAVAGIVCTKTEQPVGEFLFREDRSYAGVHVIPDKARGRAGHCGLGVLEYQGIPFMVLSTRFTVPELQVLSAERIVKWRYSARRYLKPGLVAASILLSMAIVVVNLYFRGLVYVLCGPRRNRS